MLSKIRSYRKQRRVSQLDTYTSINDLIVHIWWKIHETGDVTLLIKNKFKLSKDVLDYCERLWEDIQDQHLQKFGMPDWYAEYLEKVRILALRKINYALTQDRKLITWINIAQVDVDKLRPTKKVDNYRTKAILEASFR